MKALPPLRALQAFEAAARLGSFARAADELGVTPAALSFQIKGLEEYFGQSLFSREKRQVALTKAGQALAPDVTEGFRALQRGWRTVQRQGNKRVLSITAGPAITSLWLAPRLFAFASDHPNLDLRFVTSLELLDFDQDEIDVALRFGQGTEPGLVSVPIMDDWLCPMVAPALAEQIVRPEDILDLPLIHQDLGFLTPEPTWAVWFERMGLTVPDGGMHFVQADHAVNAALAGSGALLGRVSLTSEALGRGQLVMPFTQALKAGARYRAICRPQDAERPEVVDFIGWIKDEAVELERFTATRVFV